LPYLHYLNENMKLSEALYEVQGIENVYNILGSYFFPCVIVIEILGIGCTNDYKKPPYLTYII
jgi:hypothetical protein